VISRWNKRGIVPIFQEIGWANDEPYESKFERITKNIDKLIKQGHKVSLVGVSAGATMAINVYSAKKSKIAKVVFICGKINRPEKVREAYFNKNPAFKKSLEAAAINLQKLDKTDRAKMLSLHPIVDGVVAVRDTHLHGAKNKTVFSAGHAFTILLVLSLYKRMVINFIKA
jgi:predicted peptidase